MKNTFGNNISVTLFGESHGEAIGALIDGLPAGIEIDREFIRSVLSQRRPQGEISTARREGDEFKILSGVFEDKTCGTPICIVIENTDTRSLDYSKTKGIARPSHADYAAHIKYAGFEDYRGGGHFSGRITAAVCAAGAIFLSILSKKGIEIGTHIKKCAGVCDREFLNLKEDIRSLKNAQFAVLDKAAGEKMTEKIKEAKNCGDSVGGILETAVVGIEAGVGEPFFDSTESLLSHAVFSIPAVKGIEFGAGFSICDMLGSEANDALFIKNGKIKTQTNNSGGINGGITNSMPIIFRTAIKPTPTISKEQKTVNLDTLEEVTLKAGGRHDPCIVHRARIVVDCVTAIVLADLLAGKNSIEWLGEK